MRHVSAFCVLCSAPADMYAYGHPHRDFIYCEFCGLDVLRGELDVVVCISVCTCVYANIACAIARISAIVFSSRVQFVQCVCTCVCV